jgi:hypothetical protein
MCIGDLPDICGPGGANDGAYTSSEDGVVVNISDEAWSAIESAYRNPLPPEVRDEIEAATAAFVKQATRGVVAKKAALKRIKEIRSTLEKFDYEWAEADHPAVPRSVRTSPTFLLRRNTGTS